MKQLITFGLAASLALVSVAASAQEAAFTAGKPQLGAALNYGVYTGDDMGGDLNPYGLGFGVRGGYTLDMNLYLGANFDYFLGGSQDVSMLGVNAEVSVNAWAFMLEPGYDVALGEGLVLRPQLGLGFTDVGGEACVGSACEDIAGDSEFTVAPGAQILADLGGVFFQGGLRYHHVFVEDGNADGLLLNAGVGIAF